MKLRAALLVGLAVLLCASAWAFDRTYNAVSIRLVGGTDVEMLNQVRAALAKAKSERRRVNMQLISPGGPALVAVEIAREIRDAHDHDGVTVEIHAVSLCASGCTLVLSAGTPGYRYINDMTLFLVHPIQNGEGCVAHPAALVTQEEKVINTYYGALRDTYVRMTGQPVDVVEDWLICGHERVGRGMLAVDLHVADHVER